MQKNFAILSVCILIAALQGGVMYCAVGPITAIEILYLVFTVVCPILLTIGHSLHNDDSTGNTVTTIPAPYAVLQVISTHENKIATGLLQQ
jgi:uncharacterized membrane protein (DUF4010 family)